MRYQPNAKHVRARFPRFSYHTSHLSWMLVSLCAWNVLVEYRFCCSYHALVVFNKCSAYMCI